MSKKPTVESRRLPLMIGGAVAILGLVVFGISKVYRPNVLTSGEGPESSEESERSVRQSPVTTERSDADESEEPAEFDFSSVPPPPTSDRPPVIAEMPFAELVEGDPLMVTLPHRPELGAISIELYDPDNGVPTGVPVPAGTPVSSPDPSDPGKEVFFRVPSSAP